MGLLYHSDHDLYLLWYIPWIQSLILVNILLSIGICARVTISIKENCCHITAFILFQLKYGGKDFKYTITALVPFPELVPWDFI